MLVDVAGCCWVDNCLSDAKPASQAYISISVGWHGFRSTAKAIAASRRSAKSQRADRHEAGITATVPPSHRSKRKTRYRVSRSPCTRAYVPWHECRAEIGARGSFLRARAMCILRAPCLPRDGSELPFPRAPPTSSMAGFQSRPALLARQPPLPRRQRKLSDRRKA